MGGHLGNSCLNYAQNRASSAVSASVGLSYPAVALYLGLGWPKAFRLVLGSFLGGGGCGGPLAQHEAWGRGRKATDSVVQDNWGPSASLHHLSQLIFEHYGKKETTVLALAQESQNISV